MEYNNNIIKDTNDIKTEIIELNNIIDKKCLDIYNKNDENENKIDLYTKYLETIILEYHKVCKIMYGK